jgi:hypothetical protein
MAKYKLRAIETFETVVPASEMIFTSLVTGEEIGDRLPVPESRYTTEEGYIYTARNIKDRDNCLKSGKWELIA